MPIVGTSTLGVTRDDVRRTRPSDNDNTGGHLRLGEVSTKRTGRHVVHLISDRKVKIEYIRTRIRDVNPYHFRQTIIRHWRSTQGMPNGEYDLSLEAECHGLIG